MTAAWTVRLLVAKAFGVSAEKYPSANQESRNLGITRLTNPWLQGFYLAGKSVCPTIRFM